MTNEVRNLNDSSKLEENEKATNLDAADTQYLNDSCNSECTYANDEDIVDENVVAKRLLQQENLKSVTKILNGLNSDYNEYDIEDGYTKDHLKVIFYANEGPRLFNDFIKEMGLINNATKMNLRGLQLDDIYENTTSTQIKAQTL